MVLPDKSPGSETTAQLGTAQLCHIPPGIWCLELNGGAVVFINKGQRKDNGLHATILCLLLRETPGNAFINQKI